MSSHGSLENAIQTRDLARTYILAKDAAIAAQCALDTAGDLPTEDRVDLLLAADAAFAAQVSARIALNAAQQVSA